MTPTYYIGVDGSGPSRAALRWGVRRAAEHLAGVVLVNTVDDEWGRVGRDAAAAAERQARDLLGQEAERAAALHSGVPLSTRIVHGGTAWELTRLPRPDDLLIVGTHKTGFLRGRVLGSRSVQIAASAHCSVAIVPDSSLTSRRGVVVGVDGTEACLAAVRAGANEALRLDQDLVLVYAPAARSGEPAAAFTDLMQTAVALAQSSAPGVSVRRRIVHRDPAEALLDASIDAALLILGTSARAAGNSLIGMVTHDVLMNINVPVLVTRDGHANGPTVVSPDRVGAASQ